MKRKWTPYLLFFALLFAGYFAFVFSQTDISQSTLPVINNNVQSFSFIDQNGKKITERDVDGKVYVTEFFFTTCKGICPKMNANMRRVYDEFKNDSNFLIISHTCMPETDSVPVLKEYEAKIVGGKLEKIEDGSYRVDYLGAKSAIPANSNWHFVTGDKKQLYDMARHSYIIDNNKTPDTVSSIVDQFIHTQLFALVDKQTRVRGMAYDGLKEDEVQKLITDIKDLLKEKHQNRSLQ